MNDFQIKELTTEAEWTEAYPVMHQLRTHLDLGKYLELVQESVDKEDYRMFALYEDDQIVAVTGIMPMITLYYGRYTWVCDLVTDGQNRSKGYGDKLLSYVTELARKEGNDGIALSSGFQRVDAHRFYEEKVDFKKTSYIFEKKFS